VPSASAYCPHFELKARNLPGWQADLLLGKPIKLGAESLDRVTSEFLSEDAGEVDSGACQVASRADRIDEARGAAATKAESYGRELVWPPARRFFRRDTRCCREHDRFSLERAGWSIERDRLVDHGEDSPKFALVFLARETILPRARPCRSGAR
jgi:hypothetical protein